MYDSERDIKMKKIFIAVVTVLMCVSLISFFAFASSNTNGIISDRVEDAISNSPEVSSILDDAANGNINADALKDALSKIEGIDLDQLMKGLEGLDANDGLLGKISSIIGPDSNGIGGIISGIGSLGGSSSGAGSSAGGIIDSLINSIMGQNSSSDPTVHTTAASYTQSINNQTIYTPNYNYTPNNVGNTVNFNQYTAPVTSVIPEITTQTFTEAPSAAQNISVAIPTPEQQTKSKNGWKKAVGAILVFGSFAAIAAVVIKKSM